MIEMTVDQTVAYLDEIVAEFGEDYVYDKGEATFCHYFEGDKTPSCIVGQVLAKYGITPEDIAGMNSSGSSAVIRKLVKARKVKPVAPVVYDLLAYTQEKQDCGKSWGEAVEYGKQESLAQVANN